MTNPDALSFSTLIATQEDGQLHEDLTRAVREIIAELNNAVMEHGGIHTAAIALALAFKIDSGVIEVKAEVKTRMPKENRQRTVYWSTPDNQLTRRNPKQSELPFRDVNERNEIRDTIA